MKQSRALVNISKVKGWDPTQIYDQNTGKYVGDFIGDHDPQMWDRDTIGTLPSELPAVSGRKDPSEESALDQRVSWSAPEVPSPIPTVGLSNPTPGKTGA